MTIDWWHIQNNDPMKSIWADAAKQYMAAHPNVKINITVLENEAFKSKLTTTMQGGKVPDIFQSWGGGTLKEQADAGLVQGHHRSRPSAWIGDLNPAAAGLYQVDGKQYGIPFNLGMVGVWYRKSLFEKAGIDAPAGDLGRSSSTDIQTLKSAGITPLAVGEKDKWPGMFWWANLSLRIAGKDAMAKAGAGRLRSTPPGSSRPASELKKLIDLKPFQNGLPGRAVGRRRRRGRADGQRQGGDGPDGPVGAVDLRRQRQGQATRCLGDLGWFPFPTVDGGAGAATEQFGGGDGFAFGKDAPPEARRLRQVPRQPATSPTRRGASGGILPVKKGTETLGRPTRT